MTKLDKLWIKSMEWCSKYWGCHQLPNRSFFVCGYQLPVCARCTGIITGEFLCVFTWWILKIPLVICILLIVPMLIDGTVQYKTKYTSTNTKRFITGAMFGYGFFYIILLSITFII